MLLEQITEFELRGPEPPGRSCISTTGWSSHLNSDGAGAGPEQHYCGIASSSRSSQLPIAFLYHCFSFECNYKMKSHKMAF